MNEKRLSRRVFLKSASFATVGGLLAACAPVPPSAVAPAETKPTAEQPKAEAPVASGKLVRHWSGWGGPSYQKCWDDIQALDEFKQLMGNNTFELKLSVAEEAITTAIAGGDPPDVVTNINYLGYMSRGILMPIDNLVAGAGTKKDIFIDANWDMGFYKGVQYGIPTQECFVQFGLNYNSKLVEAAGLDPNKPPETWDEMYEWHEKLTEKDSAGNLTRIGINPYGAMAGGMWDTSGFTTAVSWGWDWFDDKSRTFDFNNEKMVDAFKTFKKFVDLVGADNMAALYSVDGHDDWGGAYNAEIECSLIEGYWHPGETYNSAPEVAAKNRASWLPVPAARKGEKVQGSGGHLWTVIKDSKSPEITYKIGEFLATQKPCEILWKGQGWLPAVKTFLDSVDTNTYPGLDFYFKSVKEATKIYAPPRCEIYSFLYNEYVSIKDQVNRNEVTPEQAAEEMQKRADTEYKNSGFAS